MLIIFILVILIVVLIVMPNNEERNNKIERIYSDQSGERLRKLLEDCTFVNDDFPIMSFVIENHNTTGFFRYTIRFRDFGSYFISSQIAGLEWAERQIQSEYRLEVDSKMGKGDLNTIIQNAVNKSYESRKSLQKDFDETFYKRLFNSPSNTSRKFVIDSPFESYASSGGKYIVDADYWKIEGDDAVYTGLLEFEQEQKNIVPYVVEKMAREFFPNADIIRYSNGCDIFM